MTCINLSDIVFVVGTLGRSTFEKTPYECYFQNHEKPAKNENSMLWSRKIHLKRIFLKSIQYLHEKVGQVEKPIGIETFFHDGARYHFQV